MRKLFYMNELAASRVLKIRTSIQLKHSHEGALGHLDGANLAHALFAFLLLFQQLALTGDVAAVALGCHVFTHLANRFAGNDFCADGRLHGNVELLAGPHG